MTVIVPRTATWLFATAAIAACSSSAQPTLAEASGPLEGSGAKWSTASPCQPDIPNEAVDLADCERAMWSLMHFGSKPRGGLVTTHVNVPISGKWNEFRGYWGKARIELDEDSSPARPPIDFAQIRASSQREIAVFAARDIGLAEVAAVQNRLPKKQLRLAVRMRASTLRHVFARRFAMTPSWARSFVSDCTKEGRPLHEALSISMTKSATGCPSAVDAAQLYREGARFIVYGEAALQALGRCSCEMHNPAGFTAMVGLSSLRQDLGWLAIPPGLPATGTVGEWVAELNRADR